MKAEINLITIWTDDVTPMKAFYESVIGFTVKNDLGDYIEFESPNVRFALCRRSVMHDASLDFKTPIKGQRFELAFPCDNEADVEASYKRLIENGAKPVQPPKTMPWNQRTALFSDPDGNIHELFCDLT
mgnify:CR=1 FL=1